MWPGLPKHSPYTRQGYIHSPSEHSAKREHAAHCHHKPTGPRLSCHHLFPPGLASGALPSFVHGAGARGSIDWKDVDSLQKVKVKFDAFVRGGAAEAEELFMNEGKPVHCLSTRFEGVNYRVSMLIGMASADSKGYIATYNPNYYNQFTGEMESEEARKSRTNGRSLLSFVKALEHTKRTKGCLVQVWAAHVLTLEPCGPAAEDPRARTRVHPGAVLAGRGSRCRPTTRTGGCTATCRRRRRGWPNGWTSRCSGSSSKRPRSAR